MTENNQLALIVGYYLSRMDKEGYISLGYKTFSEATEKIGEILSVKKNTIKNMRDEFDPYHQNDRIGWKRELRGSRQKILRAFQETDDETLLELVKEILNNKEFKETEEYEDIQTIFVDKKEKSKQNRTPVFILRGPTGKAAESFFMDNFGNNILPVSGKLVDTRDLGCGYDFEIKSEQQSYFIEVKGMAAESGGILFTNKEWQTALKQGQNYFLVIVSNLSSGNPVFSVLQDPASKLKPKKNIFTTVQVSWSVAGKDLNVTP